MNGSRWWRLAEHVLLFYGLVGLYIALRIPGGPIPVLLLAAAAIVFYLRRVDGFAFLRPGPVRPGLLLWAVATVAGIIAVALVDRDRLFDLPRTEPLLWAAIIAFYPLLSVYPQELLYRAFLLHRYAPVFGTGRGAAAASAAAFGFAHLLYGNVLAVLATIVGGWLFARRYQRTRSLLVVSAEHGLYGISIFTIGLGQYFYHGA